MAHYRLVFSSTLYEPQASAFKRAVADIIQRREMESLTILFSSEGGSTDQGLMLYNFIRELPRPIIMHGVGHIGSMAVPMFLAAATRTCTPNCRFFFHAYDWKFRGRQMGGRIEEALTRLNSDIALSRQIAARHTSLSLKKLASLYSTNPTPTIFTPQEAKTYGIVHDIMELNPEGEIQEDVIMEIV